MCVAKLVDTTVVPKSNADGHEIAGQTKSMQDPAVSAKPTGTDTSLAQKAGSLSMPLVRKTLNNRNLSSTAKERGYYTVARRYEFYVRVARIVLATRT